MNKVSFVYILILFYLIINVKICDIVYFIFRDYRGRVFIKKNFNC